MPRPTLWRSFARGVGGLVMAALALVGTARAQSPSTPGVPGAEAAVRTYTEAVTRGDWTAAGRAIDSAELEALKDVVAFLVDVDSTGEARAAFGDEGDGVAAFARFMESVVGLAPGMDEALTSMRFQILGSVAEGDSLVHVVGRSRTELFGAEVDNVEVTSVRWLGDRWAVRLDEQMRGMTQALGQMQEGGTDWDSEGWTDDADGAGGGEDDG